jgi:predicted DCC family thiol-disulfide oxidoreductase YuxK
VYGRPSRMTVPVVQFTIRGAAERAPTGLGRPYTLVYDGTCRICNPLADLVRRWDAPGLVYVIPYQTAGLEARFPWIPREAYARAIQLVGPGGRTWQGATAIEQLLSVLPRGRWIAWIFHIPLVRVIADKVYRWVARNRYRMGCGDHCQSRPLDVRFDSESGA